MLSSEEKGFRVTVTFPKKDAEWLQGEVDKGEYTSLAEVVRMCVRTMRTGGVGVTIKDPRGEAITIPREVAMEVVKNPETLSQLFTFLQGGKKEGEQLKKQFAKMKEELKEM